MSQAMNWNYFCEMKRWVHNACLAYVRWICTPSLSGILNAIEATCLWNTEWSFVLIQFQLANILKFTPLPFFFISVEKLHAKSARLTRNPFELQVCFCMYFVSTTSLGTWWTHCGIKLKNSLEGIENSLKAICWQESNAIIFSYIFDPIILFSEFILSL